MFAVPLLFALAMPVRSAPRFGPAVEFSVSGYRQNCWDGATLFRWEKSAWNRANRDLPGKGLYFLDGKFVGYGACDFVTCDRVDGKVRVALFEYRKTGSKPPPKGSGTSAQALPIFETTPLRGRLKVELTYYTDPKCTVRATVARELWR